jgi:hypothetical protein
MAGDRPRFAGLAHLRVLLVSTVTRAERLARHGIAAAEPTAEIDFGAAP